MPFYAPVSLDFLNKNILTVPNLIAGFTSIYSATVLNNTMVCVGQSGVLIIDDKGKILNSIRTGLPITAILHGVCVGQNGRLIVCSQSSGFMYSDDGGNTWVKSVSYPTAWCTGIAFGNGVAVACERNTRHVYVSNDNGETWAFVTNVLTDVTESANDSHMLFSNRLNTFVICDLGGALNFSLDGINWLASPSLGIQLLALEDYAGYIYCGSGNGNGTVHRYRNGTWDEVAINLRTFANVKSGGGVIAKRAMCVLNNRLLIADEDGFTQSMSESESVIVPSSVGTTANATRYMITFAGSAWLFRIQSAGKTLTP